MKYTKLILILLVVGQGSAPAQLGPYPERGVNGYIGDDWRHANPRQDPDKRINPIFRGWAGDYVNYLPAPDVDAIWTDPARALGPATGNHFDIVSLGDLDQDQINQNTPAGQITLTFNEPNNIIADIDFYSCRM